MEEQITYARPTEQPQVTMDSLWEASKELSKIAYGMSRNDAELGQHLGCYVKSDLAGVNIYPHLNTFGLPRSKPI